MAFVAPLIALHLVACPEGEASPPRELGEVALGGGSLGRWLDYNQDIFQQLGYYALVAGPMLTADLAFYPGALLTDGWLGDLGVVSELFHSVGGSSTAAGIGTFPTIDDRWTVGLRGRRRWDALELGLSGSYGQQEALLGAVPGATPPPIPDYTYRFVAVAIDGRYAFGPLAVLADLGYLGVVDSGIQSSGFFPHAQVEGIEAGVHLALRLADPLELRLGADYQRYFYSFNPQPGDAHVAGGAIDQYLELTLTVAGILRASR